MIYKATENNMILQNTDVPSNCIYNYYDTNGLHKLNLKHSNVHSTPDLQIDVA